MDTHTVDTVRCEGWWAITVHTPGRDIPTQARRLDQVEDMAREATALTLDVDETAFGLELLPATIDGDLGAKTTTAVHDRAAAATTAAASADSLRDAVAALTDAGYSMRDIGHLVGVSYQRVGQIAKDLPHSHARAS